ncbi:ABC transporter substrate-binding protein [Marinicrinis lubricantis]|uniref:ABC transporter substrate-binding protein n=1 Tax=Marinicrinis lubricantis TaxID=2086470 RepID=A0ABW1IVG8_9BACL
MKKYVSIFVMLFMVFTLVLSACSEGDNNTSQADGTLPANTSNSNENNQVSGEGSGNESAGYEIPEGTTITIVNGGGNSLEKQMAQYGDLLEKKFPQVNFEFKGTTSELKIDKMILGGEKFDIFIRSIGSYFMEAPENGFQYDMTELIQQHDVDLSGIDPVLLNSMTSNAGGEMWGLPFLNSTLVLYYNKDLFDTFGVDYPTDGMTWDEVLDLAKQFNQTKDGVPYVGLAVSDHHLTKLNNFGLSYRSTYKSIHV